jgi:hypothetical protein
MIAQLAKQFTTCCVVSIFMIAYVVNKRTATKFLLLTTFISLGGLTTLISLGGLPPFIGFLKKENSMV